MSYCRWSSDDFQCDVYVYADVNGGWTTHVATNRRVFTEPLPPPVESADIEDWVARHAVVMKMVDAAKMEPLDLPHDGQSFNDATPGECAERLSRLLESGYNVPQYAIDALREEDDDDNHPS